MILPLLRAHLIHERWRDPPPAEKRCRRCGHPQSWHRHDDADPTPATDPACPFRCLGYDCEAPGPPPPGGRACDCPDWVEP